MSLFGKLFTIEDAESTPAATQPANVATDPVVAVVSSVDSIVATIYEQNNLSDTSDSIYAVGKLMGTLPKEMTTQKMQETVAGILAVTEKSVPVLLCDAHKRIEVLNSAKDSIVAERTSEIERANADIECLKQAIESAQKVIKNAETVIDAVQKQVSDEVEGIMKLVQFSEGMVSN